LYGPDSPRDILLGESSVKVLKDIIDKTDGRIEPLITALQVNALTLSYPFSEN
jgi:hypothetical protein